MHLKGEKGKQNTLDDSLKELIKNIFFKKCQVPALPYPDPGSVPEGSEPITLQPLSIGLSTSLKVLPFLEALNCCLPL